MANEAVLIVDDEPKICQFLEILLQREGYKTASVNSGEAAIERLSGQENFDLLLTDLKMPGMDGFGLITELKKAKPDLPVIMITGYATVETAVQALRYGIEDYVTKPFNIDELRKVISRALQSARMVRENAELVKRLQELNEELARHREMLAARVRKTDSELHLTRGMLNRQKVQTAVFDRVAELAAEERDLKRLLDGTVQVLHERLLNANSCVMLRYGNELEFSAGEGPEITPLLGARRTLREGVPGRVAVERKPMKMSRAEVQEFVNGQGQSTDLVAGLCVPMIHHDRAIGVIVLCGREDAFPESEIALAAAVATRIAPAVENALLYRALEQRCIGMMKSFVSIVEARDHFMNGHSRRVTDYACKLAKAAGVSPYDVETISRAASLHDIGKLGISEQILDKPASLATEEMHLVRRHPITGESLLEPLEFMGEARKIVRHHHEHMDGSGYPDKLSGRRIPLLARMLSIADAYDAMTTERPWRPAMTPKQASDELNSCAGSQFDKELVDVFRDKVIAG